MNFVKYSSLTNHYESNMINAVIMNGLAKKDVMWCAREKLHGANFSFLCDGVTVTPCKRSGEILPTEGFYGCEPVVAAHTNKILELWRELAMQETNSSLVIQLYGELAGNGVQANTDYGDKDFYAFDLKVHGLYWPDNLVSILCQHVGIKMCPLLGLGTFEELKELPLSFESMVKAANAKTNPITRGYEAIYQITEEKDDTKVIAEGYVLKPVMPTYLERFDRVAIKCKSPKFSEKKNKQANTFKAPVSFSEADQAQYETFACYLTENRVRNVLSKIDAANLTAKDFGRVMGLTVQDAFEEIAREHEKQFIEWFENPTLAKKTFTNAACDLVRGRWSDILSGSF